MDTFADENLQQPSAMLKLISFWIGQSNTLPFYTLMNLLLRAILSLLSKSSEAKKQ